MLTPDDAPTAPNSFISYALPLEAPRLEELDRLLGSFGVHGLIGLFAAAGSVPGFAEAEQWLPELIRHAQFADEAEFRRAVELAMRVQGPVRSALHDGRFAALVPAPTDLDGCRSWARGYAALLARVDAAHRTGRVVEAAFAIQVLAEVPQFRALFEAEHAADERAERLAELRTGLAEHVASLHAAWAEARTQSAPRAPVVRATPKLGRNDRCPCGSGKKHKKCCGAL